MESVRKPLYVPCHSEILSRHCSSKNSFILKVLASPKAPSLTQGTHSGVELHTKVFNPPGVGLPSRTLPSSLKGLGTIYGASPFLTAFQFHHFPLTCLLFRFAPIFCSSLTFFFSFFFIPSFLYILRCMNKYRNTHIHTRF